MEMDGKVVVLSGVSGGVGPAVAQAFAGRGARLVLAARGEAGLQALARELKIDGARVLVQTFDAGDAASVQALVDAAVARFGRIDVLVNLVGGFKAGKAVHEMSDEDFAGMMALNARSVFYLCRAAVPALLAAGGGAIVNVGSPLGVKAAAGTAGYAAAKAVVLRLTEALGAELGARGVRANAVIPGTIDTPANRQAMPAADHSQWVDPSSLAETVVFLASPAASSINGAAVPVAGLG